MTRHVDWVQTDALLGALAICLGFLAWLTRKLVPLFKRTNNFLDDWEGVEARPGVEGRPGAMVRLQDHDVRLESVEALIRAHIDEAHEEALNMWAEIRATRGHAT